MSVEIIFLGTRGNISSPCREVLKYGAHTPSMIIKDDPNMIIIGAGFGIGYLSDHLQNKKGHFHILFTHFHWDNIQGLNYFAPIHVPGNTVHFYSPFPVEKMKEIMDIYFDGSYGPFNGWEALNSKIEFHYLREQPLDINGFSVSFVPVNHSDLCYAYKLARNGYSVVYASDHEAVKNDRNDALITWARGCDVLIHDAMYTDEEYHTRVGWGHSSYEMACENAMKIKPKKIILTCHETLRTDDELDRIQDVLNRKYPLLRVHLARQEVIY